MDRTGIMIMKDLNKYRKLIIISGIVLFLIGLLMMAFNIAEANKIKEYDGTNSGKVIVRSPFIIKHDAYDEMFEIGINAPILIRHVEMVQWYKDDKGVRMVFADYPLESFEDNNEKYENPEFPFYTEVFYGDVYIDDLKISESYIQRLLDEEFYSELNFTKLSELPEHNGLKYGLIRLDDAYVTASDDWDLGEVRVTYTYLDNKDVPQLVLAGTADENKMLNADPELKEIYLGEKTLQEIRNDNMKNNTLNYVLMVTGILFASFGLFYKKKNEN